MYTAISPLLFQYVYKLPSSCSTFSIWGNKYIYDQVQLDSYKLYIYPNCDQLLSICFIQHYLSFLNQIYATIADSFFHYMSLTNTQ